MKKIGGISKLNLVTVVFFLCMFFSIGLVLSATLDKGVFL